MRQALRDALRAYINKAFPLLEAESIYAFGLITDPFYEAVTPCIFTEAGLLRVAERYRKGSPAVFGANCSLEEIVGGLRWSPADSPHMGFREADDFRALHLRLGDFWRGIDADDEPARESARITLECVTVSALVELRSSALVAPSIALLLLQGDQCVEERYAFAELFNPPDILQTLWSEWKPDAELTERYRRLLQPLRGRRLC
jgi:hypothetical protein